MHEAIIIDLDGTLCDCRHREHFVKQSPPDWSAFFAACGDDTPNPAIVALYDMARDAGRLVLLVSGRPAECGAATEAWLERHGLDGYAELLMRGDGDYRPDHVVKAELYARFVDGCYNVLFAVDDRDSVVAMWRDLGLVCFQCAPGDF